MITVKKKYKNVEGGCNVRDVSVREGVFNSKERPVREAKFALIFNGFLS